MSWGRAVHFIKQFTSKGCGWIRGRGAPARSTGGGGGAPARSTGGGEREKFLENAGHGFCHKIKEYFTFGRKGGDESGDIRSGHVHLGAAIDSLNHPWRRSCWVDSGPAGDAAADGALVYRPLGVRRPNAAAKLRYNAAKKTFEWYVDVAPAGVAGGGGAAATESTSVDAPAAAEPTGAVDVAPAGGAGAAATEPTSAVAPAAAEPASPAAVAVPIPNGDADKHGEAPPTN